MVESFDEYYERLPKELQPSEIDSRTTLLVGTNGAGKSRLLAGLAKSLAHKERTVFAIANTIYDRFPRASSRLHRLLARNGRQLPETTLKRAIHLASNEGLSRLRQISRTLSFCGYDSRIGLTVSGFEIENLRNLELSSVRPSLSRAELEDVTALCYKFANRPLHHEPLWLEFDGFDFSAIDRSTYARLIGWEKILKQAQIVRSISIQLSRDGREIELRGASSGELSLITSMVFLASAIEPRSVVLVDEPENSLHPHWQHAYIELLRDLFANFDPTIVVATHSPLVVSGAEVGDPAVRVLHVSRGTLSVLENRPSSVEELLWSTFQTLTPKSHFLSEHLVDLLNSLNRGELPLVQLLERISEIREQSYDPRQEEFLAAVATLAREQTRGRQS